MLKGKRINLRLMRELDLDDFVRCSQDVSVRGEFFPLDIYSESSIRKKFQEDGYWSDPVRIMLVVDVKTDRMLGYVAAFKPVFYQESIEFGYILHDVSRRGEGLMAEAVTLFCGYIFRWKSIYRIQLQIETPNLASRRTAEKAGFTHEGTMRQCLVIGCEPRDMEMYSILRSEFKFVGREGGATSG
jgi:RimJ/RimL family protein N-acetyltransferase